MQRSAIRGTWLPHHPGFRCAPSRLRLLSSCRLWRPDHPNRDRPVAYRQIDRLQHDVERDPNPAFTGATISYMIDWSTFAAVERDSERVSGPWLAATCGCLSQPSIEDLEEGVPTVNSLSCSLAQPLLRHPAGSASPNPPYVSFLLCSRRA